MKAAKAYAFIHDRDYVIPDDVKYLAPYVLSHRIILKPEAKFEGIDTTNLVKELLAKISVPMRKEYS